MAKKMQSNETTLHFLAALDFDGEAGEEAVDAALDEAATGAAEAIGPETKPAAPVTSADLERADVASARAAQSVERAECQKPKPASAGPEEFEKHVEAGNVGAMTQAFLADLLEG